MTSRVVFKAQIMWHAKNSFSNIIKTIFFLFFSPVENSHVSFFFLQVTDMISAIAQGFIYRDTETHTWQSHKHRPCIKLSHFNTHLSWKQKKKKEAYLKILLQIVSSSVKDGPL